MSSASELKAYIVDDQRSMRSIIQMLLRQLGIKHITEAEDGAHALEQLTSGQDRPDFILCDLYMENGDGIAFINSIRRNETLRDLLIPVILLTGETDPMILGVGQQVGAAAILHKPCSAPELAKAISAAVGYNIT